MEPRIVVGMPEAEYRADPAWSQSDLKRFLLPTPAHARYALDNPSEPSASMALGTCLHSLVLEGRRDFAAAPEVDGRTTAGKATLAAFRAENQGKTILSSDDAAKVEGMAAGIQRNRGAVLLLESSVQREVSIFWAGGKARIDFVNPLGIGDLKTTKDASPKAFERAIMDFGYHIQAAQYLEGACACGLPCDDFFILAVENSAPFECAVYRVDHITLEIGRQELLRLWELARRCKESGEYPGYPAEPVDIGIPTWKIRQYENEE